MLNLNSQCVFWNLKPMWVRKENRLTELTLQKSLAFAIFAITLH